MKVELKKSKDFTEEYCCSVVKVGELVPVENSDRLMQTRINGESIVVNKFSRQFSDEVSWQKVDPQAAAAASGEEDITEGGENQGGGTTGGELEG